MERSEYETRAQAFLDKYGLTIKAAFKGDRCPPWEDGRCIHGDRYRITIKRLNANAFDPGPRSISFDWWNSLNDMQHDKRPTAYGILSSVSSEVYAPTDADGVAEEYGDGIKPSQAIAIAKFAKRLQEFFDDEELEDLAEIN